MKLGADINKIETITTQRTIEIKKLVFWKKAARLIKTLAKLTGKNGERRSTLIKFEVNMTQNNRHEGNPEIHKNII